VARWASRRPWTQLALRCRSGHHLWRINVIASASGGDTRVSARRIIPRTASDQSVTAPPPSPITVGLSECICSTSATWSTARRPANLPRASRVSKRFVLVSLVRCDAPALRPRLRRRSYSPAFHRAASLPGRSGDAARAQRPKLVTCSAAPRPRPSISVRARRPPVTAFRDETTPAPYVTFASSDSHGFGHRPSPRDRPNLRVWPYGFGPQPRRRSTPSRGLGAGSPMSAETCRARRLHAHSGFCAERACRCTGAVRG